MGAKATAQKELPCEEMAEDGVTRTEEDVPKIGELSMSFQGAYANFIGNDGLTLERCSDYTGLKGAVLLFCGLYGTTPMPLDQMGTAPLTHQMLPRLSTQPFRFPSQTSHRHKASPVSQQLFTD